MSHRTSGALLLAVLVIALPASDAALAQGPGGVVITSSPPGAVVELRGSSIISGVTPWRLNRGLSGVYEVRATKSGYADWYGSTSLSATRRDSLYIRLSRRSALSTGLRSAILPGWGQYHAGENLRGTVFLLAEAGAVAGVLYADSHRQDAMSEYEKKLRAYRNATQADEIETAREERDDAFDTLRRWHDTRKRWIYAAAAVWFANVLDAAVLIPAEEGGGLFAGASAGAEPGLFVGIEANRTTLGYSLSF